MVHIYADLWRIYAVSKSVAGRRRFLCRLLCSEIKEKQGGKDMSEINDYVVKILVSKGGKHCQVEELTSILEKYGYNYQLGRINYE